MDINSLKWSTIHNTSTATMIHSIDNGAIEVQTDMDLGRSKIIINGEPTYQVDVSNMKVEEYTAMLVEVFNQN